MTALTTSYDVPATSRREPALRRMLAGAAAFDAAGGVFCLAAAAELARWLSIPRGAVYATGALFVAAAAAGAVTRRRSPLKLGWIIGANELFALWCLLLLVLAGPNALGTALLLVATLSSAGTGAAQLLLARRR